MLFSRAFLISTLILLCGFTAYGQELLSLKEAIERGLESDFGIRILRNEERIAANNNTSGNAGFLPTVGTNASYAYEHNNTEQRFISGESSINDGANSSRLDISASADWTAFDGFRMFARKDRLELLESQSKVRTKAAMQEHVARIQLQYMQLIRTAELKSVTAKSLALNSSLLDLAKSKLKIGTGTRLAVLQASNMVTSDSLQLVELQAREEQQKIAFNRLIGTSPASSFEVDTNFTFPPILSKEELALSVEQNNFALSLLKMDIEAADLEIKEVKSALFPTLDLTAGYGYLYSKSDAGFLLSNRSYGPFAGITLRYDIFTGRSIKKDLSSAQLYTQNLQLSKESLQQDLDAMLEELYSRFQSWTRLEELEMESAALAEENTELAREMYRYGRATDFEVREAIQQEVENKDRAVEARFQQQLAAIELMRLTGRSLTWIQ